MILKNSGFEFQIDASVNCFFIKHYGTVTFDTILEGNKALAGHEDFQWDLNRLIDMTECSTDISSEDIRELTKTVTARETPSGHYRGAYLIDNALGHGIVRIFEALVNSSANSYQIIDNRNSDAKEKALSWLGLEEKYKFPDFMDFS